MSYSFAGLLSGGSAWDYHSRRPDLSQQEIDDRDGDASGGIAGKVVRAGGKWYFITRPWAGQRFRWVFDTSAEVGRTPVVGPAVLYGAIGSNSLAAVFQKGRAVGWFRGDQSATVRRRAA